MSQKVIKRLKKFCLLFDLDFEHAQTVYNNLTDKQKDHELREMKFALNIKSAEVKEKKQVIESKQHLKSALIRNTKNFLRKKMIKRITP